MKNTYICEHSTTRPNIQATNTCLASEGQLVAGLNLLEETDLKTLNLLSANSTFKNVTARQTSFCAGQYQKNDLNYTSTDQCQRGHHSVNAKLDFVMTIEPKLQHLGSNNYKVLFHFVPATGQRFRSYAKK